ncbi:ABZ1 [Candida theae]|uniref:aminodeoxychorismate synthase n=1 Tax=Candida theae TaxID=1198502 RepID=A0AAD5FZ13_9ASCO|nr:ABZ1 [Candida theae]KAI5959331.1 ABZ1 [Candida theae]
MILLIDSYDSFTNNLAQLIKDTTNQEVIIVHNDAFQPHEYESFYTQIKQHFQYIVIGPGPGHPANAEDVGIIGWLLHRIAEDSISVPVLGICLGFQSICHEFGNRVDRLTEVKHGQIYDIHPIGENKLLLGLSRFPSVRYHSLYVDLKTLNEEIEPLAFCLEENKTGLDDGEILMAVKHRKHPFYGVQYHPESICSESGRQLIVNFTEIANEVNSIYRESLAGRQNNYFEGLRGHEVHETSLVEGSKLPFQLDKITFEEIHLPESITAIDVCDHFYQKSGTADFVLLNSASIPGEWSIIGFPIPGESEVITHSVDNMDQIVLSKYKSNGKEIVDVHGHDGAWRYIANAMHDRFISRDEIKSKVQNYPQREVPFFAGYMGLISYEEGQHLVFDKIKPLCESTPDLKLVFIQRSLIFDHVTKEWFIISINDWSNWTSDITHELSNVKPMDLDKIALSVKDLALEEDVDSIKFELPSQDFYRKQFAKCQEYLHSGDSYELCLTTQSKIYLPSYINAWDIYKVLTLRKNPSPFSCFMDFDDCCLLSSSPERFVSWKDKGKDKMVELRPIKGTVRNTPDVDIAKATEILKTPKEMGENLMIVDLIRHDLYQFTENVKVTQLMTVEEYKTVFQLVSVIQGILDKRRGYYGIDILHRSLPPGSMTGAPKKRSVQLLQDIENLQNGCRGRRGIYSGVVGYWSVTDDSDWSVVIRSVFHYKQDFENTKETNVWRIGAGGAITVLSDVDGEWDEMNLKLASALSAFK